MIQIAASLLGWHTLKNSYLGKDAMPGYFFLREYYSKYSAANMHNLESDWIKEFLNESSYATGFRSMREKTLNLLPQPNFEIKQLDERENRKAKILEKVRIVQSFINPFFSENFSSLYMVFAVVPAENMQSDF